MQDGAWRHARGQQCHQRRLYQSTLVVPGLGPGIGEEHVHAIECLGGDHFFQDLDGVVLNDADVLQLQLTDARQQAAHARRMHFHCQVIDMRMRGGDLGCALAHAKADFQNSCGLASEGSVQVEQAGGIGQTPLRGQLIERALLRLRHPALTQHEAAHTASLGKR